MASLLDQLQERIQHAASQLSSLRKERDRLLAEVELMQEESRRARRILREYNELVEERKKVKERLERLFEKLDKLRV